MFIRYPFLGTCIFEREKIHSHFFNDYPIFSKDFDTNVTSVPTLTSDYFISFKTLIQM